MSAACCLEQVVSILIWDCCALQISISSALIRCCVSSEFGCSWSCGWSYMRHGYIRVCLPVTREPVCCPEGMSVLHYCAVPLRSCWTGVYQQVCRWSERLLMLWWQTLCLMISRQVVGTLVQAMDDGSSCEAEWMFHTLQSGLRHFLRSLFLKSLTSWYIHKFALGNLVFIRLINYKVVFTSQSRTSLTLRSDTLRLLMLQNISAQDTHIGFWRHFWYRISRISACSCSLVGSIYLQY